MARELNRELFGTSPVGAAGEPAEAAAPAAELRRVILRVEALNRRLKEFEARGETVNSKVDDVIKQNKQRFERVQGHFQNQNELIKNGFGDLHQKLAHVASRVNERKVNDGVVKEMVDRHTQIVQGFEVRLNQLQRLIGEQELQLINARSELKEALHELARLKKL